MNLMKKVMTGLLSAMVLVGCASSNKAVSTVQEGAGTGYFAGETLVRVGMENIGYVSVPESWSDASETDDPSNITLRYVDENYVMQISMYSFTKSELEQLAADYNMDVNDLYSTDIWLEIDIEDMSSSYDDIYNEHNIGSMTMDGNTGDAFTMYFTDDSTYSEIIFVDSDDILHFVQVETLDADSTAVLEDLLKLVQDTYTTK